MNKKIKYGIVLLSVLSGLFSCNTTKNIPEGQYLLDKIKISSDTKSVSTSDMLDYVSQQPNSEFLGLGKPQLGIYNWAGKDSSNIFNKLWRKIGSPPVIYNPASAKYSAKQIRTQLANLGYLNAEVDVNEEKKDKKAEVTYNLHPGIPYTIRNFKLDIQDTSIRKLVDRSLKRNPIKEGDIFNQEILEGRLETLNTSLRNRGYYTFGKESFQYIADSTLNDNIVDLKLTVLPAKRQLTPDSVVTTKHKPYKINKVSIISGYESNSIRGRFSRIDTFNYGKTLIYYDRAEFIKPSTLLRNCYIYPDRLYNERLVELTYNAMTALGCVKQVNIQFNEVQVQDSTKLDCVISVTPGNIHWMQTTIEGTNSAGDLGIGLSVSYQHRNFFNGAETFRVKLKGAYEAVTGSSSTDLLNENYYEYGLETGLSFPRFLIQIPALKERNGSSDVRLSYDNQLRPEYHRVFFNTGLSYKWNTARNRITHSLDIVDINYVFMPTVSQEFQDSILNNPNNKMLKYSYENQFIYRTAYNFVYTSQIRNSKSKDFYTVRAGVELAGNLFYGVSKLLKSTPNENGSYEILNNPFAQYVKGDFDFARSFSINRNNSLAVHAALGAAYPYLNSIVLPFEKRYYSGGSNSVRGWSTRQLGPGSYDNKGVTDFMNQSGDMKLDLSIELRSVLAGPFQLGTFFDAGNIWTLRNYENQPGGQFKLNKFYKEIACSWGLGIRLDFDFLVFRVDAGMKIYDPSQTGSDKWRITKPDFWDDFAFHFAIGYPF